MLVALGPEDHASLCGMCETSLCDGGHMIDTRAMSLVGNRGVHWAPTVLLAVFPVVAFAQATVCDAEVIDAVKVFVGWVSTLAEVQRVAVAFCTEGHTVFCRRCPADRRDGGHVNGRLSVHGR